VDPEIIAQLAIMILWVGVLQGEGRGSLLTGGHRSPGGPSMPLGLSNTNRLVSKFSLLISITSNFYDFLDPLFSLISVIGRNQCLYDAFTEIVHTCKNINDMI
jgi:hypothetical protein